MTFVTGTGKTATFAIGILQRLDVELKECQALVLAPTRELAQQIVKVISSLGDFMNIRVHACVGGTAVREDQRILQEGVHVVVGTPGRVYDMISVCIIYSFYFPMYLYVHTNIRTNNLLFTYAICSYTETRS